MRCSVCQHVFTYTIEPEEVSLEKEFDMLLSSESVENPPAAEASPPVNEPTFEDSVLENTEAPLESPTEGAAPEEASTAPGSVIREIDSILGAGTEEEAVEEEAELPETGKRSYLKVAVLVICIFTAVFAGLWLMKDKIPFLKEASKETPTATPLKGPFFTIDEPSLSFELLTHEQEGSVLVVKGNLRKITDKPVESVMVEARVYDKAGKLIESRLAYAGIVPDTSEFTKQPQKDIDALLTSDPSSPGSTLPASDIPFAVAFFGKPAQDGASFKVEVKDIRWK
jgi:hypothetical protein